MAGPFPGPDDRVGEGSAPPGVEPTPGAGPRRCDAGRHRVSGAAVGVHLRLRHRRGTTGRRRSAWAARPTPVVRAGRVVGVRVGGPGRRGRPGAGRGRAVEPGGDRPEREPGARSALGGAWWSRSSWPMRHAWSLEEAEIGWPDRREPARRGERGGPAASDFSLITAAGVSAVGLHVPRRRTRSRSAWTEPPAAAARRRSCRAWRRTPRSVACARVRDPCPPTTAPDRARSRASTACSCAPATVRGASRPGPPRRGWSWTRCSGERSRSRRSSTPRGSACRTSDKGLGAGLGPGAALARALARGREVLGL